MNDDKRVQILAKACAELVSNFDEDTKEEMSVEFTALFNNAIKYVTPLEFTRTIHEELMKGNKS